MKKLLLVTAILFYLVGCSSTESKKKAPAAASKSEPTKTILDEDRVAVIKNGTFEEGLEGDMGLTYWNKDSSGGSAIFTVLNGELKIEVSDPGPDLWSIGLYQPRVNIREGYTYRVTFKARSEDERNITSYFGKAAPPWTDYGGDTVTGFTLSKEMTEYEYTFTSPHSDIKAQMCFSFGNVGGQNATTIYLDDVVIQEISSN